MFLLLCLSEYIIHPAKRQIKQQEPSAEADGSYQMADPNSAGNEYGKLELVGARPLHLATQDRSVA